MSTIPTTGDGLNPQESPKPTLKEPKVTGPLRVLVITTTHLVPGSWFEDKIEFLTDEVCQHVWGRGFNELTDRRTTKHCTFGYPGRKCFFMLDYIGDERADGHPDVQTLMNGDNIAKRVRMKIKIRDLKEIQKRNMQKKMEDSTNSGPNVSSAAAADKSPGKNVPVVEIPMLQYRWDGTNLIQDHETTYKIYQHLRKRFPFPAFEDNPTSCLKEHKYAATDRNAKAILHQRRVWLQRMECLSIPSMRNLVRFSEITADRGDMAWLERRLSERGKEGRKIYLLFLAELARAKRIERRAMARSYYY
ncbi:hypothetical protein V8F20_012472 [Naviculisporaceae sp. PSN 640]